MASKPLGARARPTSELDRALGIAKLRRVGGEEVQAILDERAAQFEDREEAAVVVFLLAEELGLRRVAGQPLPETARPRIKLGAGEFQRSLAVECVGAALGDDIDHAAGRSAVFRLEAGALDLHFADELERDGALAAERGVTNVGDFDAVDDEDVLRTARAVDRIATDPAPGTAAAGPSSAGICPPGFDVEDHTRRHLQQRVESASLRSVINKFLGDVRRGLA